MAPARPVARAPRNGRNMPPAHALDETNSDVSTTTRGLVRATGFDDIQEASETTLIIGEESLHFAEDGLVVAAVERTADAGRRAIELAEDVGEVRRRILAVGARLVEVARDGEERLVGVEIVRALDQRQLRVDGAIGRIEGGAHHARH